MTDYVIDHLGARGDGVVQTPDGPLYVPFAAPGDRVQRAGDGAVVSAHGLHRQTPPCPHFGQCGGCALQHVDDATYRQWLVDRVRFALVQHGLDATIGPAAVSPPGSRRRAVWQARWHDGRLRLGYSALASHDTVDVIACPVLRPALLAMAAPLRPLLAALLAQGKAARVALLDSDAGVDMLIEGLGADDFAVRQKLIGFAAGVDLARLSVNDGSGAEIVVERRSPLIPLGRALVAVPPGGFIQATREGEQALIAALRDGLGGCRKIADLFAGLGSFSFVAAEWASVHAVEGARPALTALAAARAGVRGLKPISTEHRDLFRRPMTALEMKAFDGVVLDPPRAGALAQCRALAASGIARVMMISCNPNTFARDARALADGGYRLDWVRPVGQFLWSREVELAALFTR